MAIGLDEQRRHASTQCRPREQVPPRNRESLIAASQELRTLCSVGCAA